MRAFVTGSTGLLGTNLVEALSRCGHQVVALSRSAEKAAKVLPFPGVISVAGDMKDVDGFARAIDGCDVLFHAAAFFRDYYHPGDHSAVLQAINVAATIRLMEQAAQRGVARVIYVSSGGVIGMKASGAPGDESTPPGPLATSNRYFHSKVLAERALDEFEEHHSLPIVRILPGWMFGPRDSGPTGSGQMVLDFLSRGILGVFDGGASSVDARDVAEAMITAVDKGKPGHRYIVGGIYLTLEGIFEILARVSGVPPPRLHVPYSLAYATAVLIELYARITGSPAVVTRETSRLMHAKLKVDSSRAVSELGVAFRPFEDTLRDEVTWFRREGHIADKRQ
jgi:dihydroflavonol-4-reductase